MPRVEVCPPGELGVQRATQHNKEVHRWVQSPPCLEATHRMREGSVFKVIKVPPQSPLIENWWQTGSAWCKNSRVLTQSTKGKQAAMGNGEEEEKNKREEEERKGGDVILAAEAEGSGGWVDVAGKRDRMHS